MWIDDDIRLQSILHERHIFFWDDVTNCALLSMPRGELITNYRLSKGPESNLGKVIPAWRRRFGRIPGDEARILAAEIC